MKLKLDFQVELMNDKGALHNQLSLGNSENCLEEVDFSQLEGGSCQMWVG